MTDPDLIAKKLALIETHVRGREDGKNIKLDALTALSQLEPVPALATKLVQLNTERR